MLTNILLGLILGIVITSFIILNNKIINLYKLLNKITDIDLTTNTNITEMLKLFSNLVERFNKRILVDNEHFEIIKNLLNNRFKDLDNSTDSIYDRLNTIDSDTQNLIIAEHRCTRNEIKKKAKISSKIKSQSKILSGVSSPFTAPASCAKASISLSCSQANTWCPAFA